MSIRILCVLLLGVLLAQPSSSFAATSSSIQKALKEAGAASRLGYAQQAQWLISRSTVAVAPALRIEAGRVLAEALYQPGFGPGAAAQWSATTDLLLQQSGIDPDAGGH
jgi:hypothetical protein